MIMQMVKFSSDLPFDEVRKIAEERAKEFRAVPGLLQKYYLRIGDSGQYAGVYIWDKVESMKTYRDSDLAASIPQAYHVLGPPEIELYEVAFRLHE